MSFSKTAAYREDSDADDEYERDLMSPTLPPDFQHSPTESDDISTEQTPTYSHRDGVTSPRGKMMDWTADQSADFIAELGLEQYADVFVGKDPSFSSTEESDMLI
jgi:protein STE50